MLLLDVSSEIERNALCTSKPGRFQGVPITESPSPGSMSSESVSTWIESTPSWSVSCLCLCLCSNWIHQGRQPQCWPAPMCFVCRCQNRQIWQWEVAAVNLEIQLPATLGEAPDLPSSSILWWAHVVSGRRPPARLTLREYLNLNELGVDGRLEGPRTLVLRQGLDMLYRVKVGLYTERVGYLLTWRSRLQRVMMPLA